MLRKKIRFSVKTSSLRIPQVKTVTRLRDNTRRLRNEPYEICMDDFISKNFTSKEKVVLFSKWCLLYIIEYYFYIYERSVGILFESPYRNRPFFSFVLWVFPVNYVIRVKKHKACNEKTFIWIKILRCPFLRSSKKCALFKFMNS